MLKHNDIIEKLDLLQKVSVVASGLESEPLEQAGIAAPRASLEALAEKRGVPYASAVRAWDSALLEGMTKELVADAAEGGARLFVTPDLKVAVDPEREGLSEDSYLNGEIGASLSRATREAGGAVGLGRLSVEAADYKYLDRREDLSATHELVVKPFLLASAEKAPDALFLTPNRAGSGYPDTNRALFKSAAGGRFGTAFLVGENVEPTGEALSFLQNGVSLGGAKLIIERSAKRFRQLKEYCEEGSISERELNEAILNGSALEEEKIDALADDVIEFCTQLSEREIVAPLGDEARKKLAEDCIVLLKNEHILPLARKTKIAVLGEAYADLSFLGEAFEIVGQAQGYEWGTDRSDALIPEAVRVAGGADVSLVFLYPGEEGFELPANRIALLAALKRAGRKVIALVCGDRPVDMAFDSDASACLLLPADGPFAGEALARILTGEVSPSGKLTRTLYDNAEAYFKTLTEERDAGRFRIGAFTGYVRYDSSDEKVRYPFGFGLGYTKFVYSKLKVEGDNISFTVKNAGKRDGSEIAQIYIGAPSLTHVAPKKQLRGFVKVSLRAGESKQVSLTVPAARYGTFDPRILDDDVEGGVYQIYVCASALDVRLRGKRTLQGAARNQTDESPADYFPNGDHGDVAKVREEGRVGVKEEISNKKLRVARKAALYLMPVLVTVCFLLLTMLILSYAFDYLLFEIDETIAQWVVYAFAAVILSLIPLVGSLNKKRLVRVKTLAVTACPFLLFACLILGYLMMTAEEAGEEEIARIALIAVSCIAIGAVIGAIVASVVEREVRRSKRASRRWAKYYYEPVREEKVTPAKDFEEAFRAADAARAASPKKEKEPELPPVEIVRFYDKQLTYAVMLRDCLQYAKERGVVMEEAAMRDYLAALSSAQLILIPKGDGATLCTVVAEYFGRKVYVDNAEQYIKVDDLFTRWKQNERELAITNFSAAINAAKKESAFLHTVLIRHVDPAFLTRIFDPVADLIASRKTEISTPEGDIVLPPNLRIVAEVEKNDLTDLPASVAEAAAVLKPEYKAEEPAERKTVLQSVGFERFSALRETVRDEFPLSEATWKNIDRLDEKCRSGHIGNLVWLKMERHASVASACGAAEADSLKGAFEAELLPWLSAVWDEELCGGALRDTVKEIFGMETSKAPAEEGTKPKGRKAKQ